MNLTGKLREILACLCPCRAFARLNHGKGKLYHFLQTLFVSLF